MKLTKALIVCLLILSRAAHSMEPEAKILVSKPTEKSSDFFKELEKMGGWLGKVARVGETQDGFRISQLLAQELFRQGPPVKKAILSRIEVPFKAYVSHIKRINSAVFNCQGDKVVTASNDKTAIIWDVETGKAIHILNGHTEKVFAADFNPKGDVVFTNSEDGTARMWDIKTGRTNKVFDSFFRKVLFTSYNQECTMLVTVEDGGIVILWDVDSARSGNSLQVTTNRNRILRANDEQVNSALFNQMGDKVVTASEDQTARIWDAKTRTTIHILQGHADSVNSAVFNQMGDKVVTASDDKTARIWDANTGATIHILQGHAAWVNSAVFNRTGDKVVTASSDNTARIWDVETGELLYVLEGHSKDVNSAVFNYTGDKVVTASRDRTARIWDMGPLIESERFLKEDCTLLQAALLNDVFKVIYLNRLREDNPSEVDHLAGKELCFDFNKYPLALWNEYTSLPEGIKSVLDPYIKAPILTVVENSFLPSKEECIESTKRKEVEDGEFNPAKRLKVAEEDVFANTSQKDAHE